MDPVSPIRACAGRVRAVGGAFRLTMIRGSETPVFRTESAQSAAASAVASARRRASARELSPLARAIAAEPVSQAISPVVLGGIVRAIEFAIIVTVGAAVYGYAVYPVEGFDWRDLVAHVAV